MDMTKTEALKQLLAKVESGETHIATMHFEKVFKTGFGWAYQAYHDGSLDAAKELHDATLGFDWDIERFSINGDVGIRRNRPLERECGFADMDPARAWLIAILKALIAQEEA